MVTSNIIELLSQMLDSDSLLNRVKNYASLTTASEAEEVEQLQTNDVFSDKWSKYNKSSEKEGFYEMQKSWYLKLYGFDTEANLASFLSDKKIIFDAGCGLGYKAAWFARLAPNSLVIGMDYSDAAKQAAKTYEQLDNLFFIKGNIANTKFFNSCVDYVSCDQVIMHTQKPEDTFSELTRIAKEKGGQFGCYFYAQKALPRELLDDYFRVHCTTMSSDELWVMSEQLTELGKNLSELKTEIKIPDIPALGIKGGQYDIQRFIYWNFLKCFWNEDLGPETSVATNFDWYSPSNAKRFTEEEVKALIFKNGLSITHFHKEEACYSGRFVKR